MIKSFSSFNSSARELREQGEVRSLPHCKADRASLAGGIVSCLLASSLFLSFLYYIFNIVTLS